jgi:hypothetical protein
MKTLIAGLVAASLLASTAAQAAISVGIGINTHRPVVVRHRVIVHRHRHEVCHIVRHHGRVCHWVYY